MEPVIPVVELGGVEIGQQVLWIVGLVVVERALSVGDPHESRVVQHFYPDGRGDVADVRSPLQLDGKPSSRCSQDRSRRGCRLPEASCSTSGSKTRNLASMSQLGPSMCSSASTRTVRADESAGSAPRSPAQAVMSTTERVASRVDDPDAEATLTRRPPRAGLPHSAGPLRM